MADKATGPGVTQHLVAMIVLASFGSIIGALCWHSVPPENKDAMNIALGVLGGAFTMVVGFYFGSTASSREKDATINSLAVEPPANTEIKP